MGSLLPNEKKMGVLEVSVSPDLQRLQAAPVVTGRPPLGLSCDPHQLPWDEEKQCILLQ